MKKSKLLEVIQSLNREEMEALSTFLRSPYVQTTDLTEDEWRLFEFLQSHYPDFPDAQMQMEVVYDRIYPGSPFVKGKLNKKMSALLKRVEQFLFFEEMRNSNSDFQRLIHISRFYRRKGLERLYQISLKHLRKFQDAHLQKDQSDLLNEFLLQKEIAEFQSQYNTRKQDLNLLTVQRSLDEFYLASKLEYSTGLLSQSEFHRQIDLRDTLLILEKISPLLEQEAFTKEPLIKVYAQMYLILQKMRDEEEDMPRAYLHLEDLLHRYEDRLPLENRKALHAFCRSYYTRQFNKGRQDLQEKIFQLYRDHLEKGYLLTQGGITPGVYKNIVNIALRLKKYDWVFAFLQKGPDEIAGAAHPEDVHHLNLATYYFHLQDYEKAMSYLVDTYDDLYYQIAAKRLEIKIYFEEQSPLLESKLDAFRLFLRRLSEKKLPQSSREANNNFINALKQIIQPKTYKNPQRIQALQEKITAIPVIKEKEWLLEKLK